MHDKYFEGVCERIQNKMIPMYSEYKEVSLFFIRTFWMMGHYWMHSCKQFTKSDDFTIILYDLMAYQNRYLAVQCKSICTSEI